MLLERITIRNFQRHCKRVIDLESITVFIGPTDAGKSSIIRALRWLALNKPNGEAFIRNGADSVSVKLTFDGHEITRERGPGRNVYTLDGKTFTAFGQDVPPEITAALNLGPDNFQLQHDGPYWFNLSPGECSRELNAIVNLDLIDRTLGNIASDLRRAKTTVEVVTDRLTEAKAERERLVWVTDADTDLRAVEKQEKVLQDITSRIARLTAIVQNGESLTRTLADAGDAIQDGRTVVSVGDRLTNLVQKIDRLSDTISRIDKAERTLTELQKELYKKERILADQKSCPLCGQSFSGKIRKKG